jgi:hypothetical protein
MPSLIPPDKDMQPPADEAIVVEELLQLGACNQAYRSRRDTQDRKPLTLDP